MAQNTIDCGTGTAREIRSYEELKQRLGVILVGTSKNMKQLSHCVHAACFDMSLVCVMIEAAGSGPGGKNGPGGKIGPRTEGGETGDSGRAAPETRPRGGIVRYAWLPEEILAGFGLTPESVLHDALSAMQRRYPAKISPIGQILQIDEEPAGLLVLTSAIGIFGAAAMFYPHVLREAAMRVGKSFFILPSSVHEVLLLPDHGEHDARELHEMVAAINRSEVAEQDVLTDSVYYYDAAKPDAEALQIVFSAV